VAARGPLTGVVAGLLETAAGYYASGARGLAALPRRCAFAVDAARRIYAAIGDRVAASGHDVFAPRAVVPAREKARLVAAAAASAARHAPRRSRVVYRRDLPELSFEALVGGSAAREVEIG
jgi:phytoene synthase